LSTAVFPVVLAVSGLGAGPAACVPQANISERLARQAVERVMEGYVAAYHQNNASAMAQLYAPDGFLLPPGREMIRGRDAIREFWDQGMEAGIEMENVTVGAGGGTGYVVGRYHIPADDDGEAESGKYVITLRRQSDGVWRVAADIWNEDGDGSEETSDSTGQSVARASWPSSEGQR
jgi:uncharacterized protein (TIGR02246 family)